MTATVRLQEPFVLGSRRVYPVVAEMTQIFGGGMVASVLPLALIIEEDGVFSYTLLEADSFIAVLEKLVCPAL